MLSSQTGEGALDMTRAVMDWLEVLRADDAAAEAAATQAALDAAAAANDTAPDVTADDGSDVVPDDVDETEALQ